MSSGSMRQCEVCASAIAFEDSALTAEATQTCTLDHALSFRVVGQVLLVDVCGDRSGEYCVRADVVLAQSHGAALHERQDAGLCWRIVAVAPSSEVHAYQDIRTLTIAAHRLQVRKWMRSQ